jgi:hypothetical protein
VNEDCVLSDTVIPVTQDIPAGIHGLHPTIRIGCPGHDLEIPFLLGLPDKLPLPPGELLSGAYERSGLPTGAVID